MKRMQIKKIVLAYSGGLDTSVILKWLKETYQCPVVAFAADLGQGEELAEVAAKAQATGADEVYIEDLKEEFVRDFVWPMFRANALYEGAYLLGTSIARPLIAKAQVEVARQDRRRRREPRRHRQGQRPGALRAHLPGPGPGPQDYRALAGVGPGGPGRVRRLCPEARHPGAGDPGKTLFQRPEPAAHQLRGRHPGRPLGRAAGGYVRAHQLAGGGPG